MPKAGQKLWTREEIVRALALYCETPFGLLHQENPDVITLSREIGRTPGSVALKLVNFASFDPHQRARDIRGMGHASRLDREVWDAFYGHWDMLADAALVRPSGDGRAVQPPVGPTAAERTTRVRRGQDYFRRMVFAAYGGSCWITRLSVPELLRASHILPWASAETERLNPRNGLCLNALHDAAFDRGLLAFDDNNRVLLSPRLAATMTPDVYDAWFRRYERKQIDPPERFQPDPVFLSEHRTKWKLA